MRWCCRLIDSVASDGRSSTSHRWRIASRSARRGGFTRVRHGIVVERRAEPPRRRRAVMALFIGEITIERWPLRPSRHAIGFG